MVAIPFSVGCSDDFCVPHCRSVIDSASRAMGEEVGGRKGWVTRLRSLLPTAVARATLCSVLRQGDYDGDGHDGPFLDFEYMNKKRHLTQHEQSHHVSTVGVGWGGMGSRKREEDSSTRAMRGLSCVSVFLQWHLPPSAARLL